MTDRYSDLNPGAITAALRSFPRRYRATLAADPTRERDEIAALRTPDGRSVREVLATTVAELSTLGHAVHQVLVSDNASVPAAALGGAASGAAPTPGAGLSDLDRLEPAANAIADEIAKAPSAALLRTGTAPGGASVSAIDIARQAVRVGADNLRALEKAMEAGGIDVSRIGDADDGNEG